VVTRHLAARLWGVSERLSEFGDDPVGIATGRSEVATAVIDTRRNWSALLLVTGGLLTAGILVGALVVTSSSSDRSSSLRVVILDETSVENPAPANVQVTVGGVTKQLAWEQGSATVDVADTFADADQVPVSLSVPELVEFTVTRAAVSQDAPPVALVRISDDSVELEGSGGPMPRVNPARASRQLASERQRAEAAAIRVERARVRAVLWDALYRYERANGTFDGIWAGRERAPYDEIHSVTHAQVLPEIRGVIADLAGASSADTTGQQAIDAARSCLVAMRDYYEREASFDGSQTDDQNEGEQQAAFDRTGPACSEWGRLAASLGA